MSYLNFNLVTIANLSDQEQLFRRRKMKVDKNDDSEK